MKMDAFTTTLTPLSKATGKMHKDWGCVYTVSIEVIFRLTNKVYNTFLEWKNENGLFEVNT